MCFGDRQTTRQTNRQTDEQVDRPALHEAALAVVSGGLKNSRFADRHWGKRYGKLSVGAVKFYNDGVVQAVTFAYLIY